jgi:HD superfamily phosphodiesterase
MRTPSSNAGILLLCAILVVAPMTGYAEGAWRETVRQFAAEHFKNPAWGYSHSVRDYALARELAADDHVALDDDILFAAAYLHDMAAFKPWENDKLDHSDVGAKTIDIVLKGTDFPMGKIDAVRAAIRTHMYYRDPIGPEAIYLHDADALDWLGAIGVARAFSLVDPNGGEMTGPDAVKSIEENLIKVPPRVFSKAGRAQIAPRVAEERQFLENLRRESDNLKTL